jgi:hypothetical protein
MSGWTDICHTNDSFQTCALRIIDQWPIYLSVAMNALSFETGALYLWVLWAGTWADFGLNTLLRYLIAERGPHPTMQHHAYEMPASSSQQLLCVVTMCVLFSMVYHVRPRTLFLVWAYVFGVLAMYARLYFRINTLSQLAVGAMVGTVEGVVYSALWFWLGYPFTQKILEWSPMRWLGVTDWYTERRVLDQDYPHQTLRADVRRVRRALQLRTDEEAERAIHRLSAQLSRRDRRKRGKK